MIQSNHFVLVLILLVFSVACSKKGAIDDIENAPIFTEADEKYANVYQDLGGIWVGVFKVFEDQENEKRMANSLENIDLENLKKPSLKLKSSIKVEQTYISESPYFQSVKIKDFYENEDGTTRVIESKGVNKVQDGKMWCVIQKPDETVIHQGHTEGKQTIIWQRNEPQNQKIEYFRETVRENVYEIIGYGYYEGQDTTLMPKLWFYGRYERSVAENTN